MEFWPIFDIFHWLRPYLCSKREYLGFHKQATHRRHDDEPFFTLGSTVHDWGWPKNGPFWTKKGQTWQACQHSKVVQKGPKGTKMVNLNVFDHLGPILGPSGPFWTILDKNDFFAPNGQSRGWQRCFGAKYQFLFETVQKGPDGPKRVPYGQKHLGWPFWSLSDPFGPLWSVDKPAMFGPFWSKMDHF